MCGVAPHAAQEHGRELGLDLEEQSAAGGSDGNLVGHLVPVLDGLGAEGGGAHADDDLGADLSGDARLRDLSRLEAGG